ncbi:MAG: 6,7-dimethyl-8-ribityllumazine synthase [Spirochaetaceae bacterium]|nr:6,7-dimethyl-8-ribityllumazine synthase [Spirochaetaceae bacterium]
MKTAAPAPPAVLDGTGRRFAIPPSRYNHEVTGRLVDGATEALTEHGVAGEDVQVAWVPGSFELPLAAQRLAQAGNVSGVICVGCIIKGETNHDEVVAHAVAAGITQVALRTGVPVLLGVVSANDQEQALARAGGFENRGREAALAALEMAGGGEE